jgi:dTDP-L-rhamnose 4-epimerase
MPLRVLVTGGAGFIGRRLVDRLVADGHSVVVLDSLVPQVHGESRPAVPAETIWADVRDLDALRTAMRGVDVVHHLAAETGVGQSQYEIARYVGVNTFGTSAVLQSAIEAGARQVVIASSRAVYGEGRHRCPRCHAVLSSARRTVEAMDAGLFDLRCPTCGTVAVPEPTPEEGSLAPTSIYGVTKVQQEELALAVAASHDLGVTVLRLFNVFGPGQSLKNPYVGVLGTFFRRIRSHRPVELYEDGRMLRDFVFVDDVVEVFRAATGGEGALGRTWNVGTGEAVTLEEMARALGRALDDEPELEVSGRYRLGDVRHAVADVSRLAEECGAVPSTPLEKGLRAFVEWALGNEEDALDDLAEDQLRSRHLLRQSSG